MNDDFIPGFLKKGYELKKQCRIDITSCVNYTYYILYNLDTKDLLLLKDSHACLATTPVEPEIIHLEEIYSQLYCHNYHVERVQSTTYHTDQYKQSYSNEEDYNERKVHLIKWYQDKVDLLQDIIDTYLNLLKLKNKYKG